jgi:hypothetical protein
MSEQNNKSVYILSLEASDIYSHMHRDTNINFDYCGMIPFSLELMKLRKEGLSVKYIKSRDKEISNDIINVKFKQKVKSGVEFQSILNKKKKQKDINEDYLTKIEDFLSFLEDNVDEENWKEVSISNLRSKLYTEGFQLKFKDKKTGKTKITDYVVYKRSSSKSRTGQCLFIKKSLYNKMIKWSRLDLPLKKNMSIDLAGLLAYESLVGSSLEDTIHIDPSKILMVDDVESKFTQTCNVVKTGEDGFLGSFKEDAEVTNSLFDGESLLDSKYFEEGISMKLLRNHMFKSAAFNTNIQQYFKDNCPNDVSYEEWKLKDMFGNELYAKDIDLICTPSSLKALKFSKVLGDDKDMWAYWKEKIKEDGNVFGVCKHDKQSKFGVDENGNVLQQTSYQMINCLPIKKGDISLLTKTEEKYINRLKNDDDFFFEKIKETATLINSNQMLYDLYKHNKDIINTNIVRKFRKDFIWNHNNHSKKGKIKLKGDYCVMLGNPMEYLEHAIGSFNDTNKKIPYLEHNEVYTTLFDFDKEYVGFRNPNTSPSNVLIVKNKKVAEIEKYFNLSENIVCVNAINFPIQDILSGCDYDSDTVLLLDDQKLLELGKMCFEKYHVCLNKVAGQKRKYKLNKHDMYEIDNQLSTSQRDIGKVVNLGQFCMSVYWDFINKGDSGEHVDEMLRKVDVMTVLSGISIDMAKKFYEINIDKEIKNVQQNKELSKRKKKPMFWKYVSQSKTIDKRIEHFDCPMDYLIEKLNESEPAKYKINIDVEDILSDTDIKKFNYKQFDKIIENVEELDNSIKNINAKYFDKEEKNNKIEEITRDFLNPIQKLKINELTMNVLVRYFSETNSKLLLRLLNLLYNSQKENFLKTFKKGKK